MKTITVGQLRQNPTQALDDVERGDTYVVTRHSREVARLVPVPSRGATPEAAMAVYLEAPLPDDSWSEELAADRDAVYDEREGNE